MFHCPAKKIAGALQISPAKLDGSSNYLSLSRSCMLFIKARGLCGYLTAEMKKPTEDPLAINKWEAENSLIMSWLINDAQVYELRKKVHEAKQGEMTIAQNFAELISLWQELDFYRDFQAECPKDAAKLGSKFLVRTHFHP